MTSKRKNRVVFVYSGYGSQSRTMGQKLFSREPVFRYAIEECAAIAGEPSGRPFLSHFTGQPDGFTDQKPIEAEVAALFALQVALTALWRSFGLAPDAVVGHSIGEVAAAWAAGGLTLSSAVQIILHSSRLFQKAAATLPNGTMIVVQLPLAEAQGLLSQLDPGRITVAAHNSPRSVVLSGDWECCQQIMAVLKRRRILYRRLTAPGAGHSPYTECILDELTQALKAIHSRRETTAIYSTVTGGLARGQDFGGAYWSRNVRQMVRFADAVDVIRSHGYDLFLEISAHPILLQPIAECFRFHQQPVILLPSLERSQDDSASISSAMHNLNRVGFQLDLRREAANHVHV